MKKKQKKFKILLIPYFSRSKRFKITKLFLNENDLIFLRNKNVNFFLYLRYLL